MQIESMQWQTRAFLLPILAFTPAKQSKETVLHCTGSQDSGKNFTITIEIVSDLYSETVDRYS